MGNKNHTQGEWVYLESDTGIKYIQDKDSRYLATVHSLEDGKNNDERRKESEANAKLIIKAVNNHYKLIEVLQNIVDYEERCRAKGDPCISDHWFNPAKKLLQSIEQNRS